LRWRTSATGVAANVLFDSTTPNLTQNSLENSMAGVSFQGILQSRVGDVFTSTLSATVDSNAYDGVSISCDDVGGVNVATSTLPLQLVNTPPSPPLNLAVSQADCSTNGVCGNASALVMWDCPANTGGTNVTGFNVSVDSNVNGISEYYIVSPTDLSQMIDGLLLNANYTATVTASNCNGTSEASTIIIFNSTSLLPPTGVTICSLDSSSIQIRWENPPGNEGLFCPVREIDISWMVDDGTSGSVTAPPTNTSYDIADAVQNATYNVTVTYQTADECEASGDISVMNDESLMDCPAPQPTPTPTTSLLTSSSPPIPSSPSATPIEGPSSTLIIVGVIVAVLVLLLLTDINIVLFWIWWTRRSDISKCAEITIMVVHFVTVVGIPFGITVTILCCKYCECCKCCKCCKETKTTSKCFKITITVILILTLVGIPFAIAIWCCCKEDEKGEKEVEHVELKEPSPGSSPAPDSGPPPAVYADPNTIQREEFPGTQDVYTVPDKKKKKA